MSIDNMTYGELKQVASLFGGKCDASHPYVIGEKYFLRMVTMALTGRLVSVGAHELVLEDAAWIADTGRYAQAVATAEFNEVEPYPDGRQVIVGRAALIDAVTIPALPRKQK